MANPDKAGDRGQILLVEDDPGTQKLTTIMLEDEGFAVTVAANGVRALDAVSTQVPDLIITDYMMPEMDGAELIDRLRADPRLRDLPIILTSAALPPTVDPQVADAFIPKTGNFALILETAQRLIAKRARHDTPQPAH